MTVQLQKATQYFLLESSYGNIPSCSWPNHSSDYQMWSIGARGGFATWKCTHCRCRVAINFWPIFLFWPWISWTHIQLYMQNLLSLTCKIFSAPFWFCLAKIDRRSNLCAKIIFFFTFQFPVTLTFELENAPPDIRIRCNIYTTLELYNSISDFE